jgi:Fe-S cluster assembly iron-binding protein IscA
MKAVDSLPTRREGDEGVHTGEEGEMVIVTTRAKEALALIKESANVSDPMIGLRLEKAAAGRYDLFPDQERPGDQIVEHEGARVLLIDDELTESLAGAKIDGKTTDHGLELVIARAREEE